LANRRVLYYRFRHSLGKIHDNRQYRFHFDHTNILKHCEIPYDPFEEIDTAPVEE